MASDSAELASLLFREIGLNAFQRISTDFFKSADRGNPEHFDFVRRGEELAMKYLDLEESRSKSRVQSFCSLALSYRHIPADPAKRETPVATDGVSINNCLLSRKEPLR